mmetsp:Transcript_39038/g.110577  ORF Transcript_39038/g.110577 Transcript_39038/m.110577 type:complete len:271 (+) Transcript_39038:788-1600(+)
MAMHSYEGMWRKPAVRSKFQIYVKGLRDCGITGWIAYLEVPPHSSLRPALQVERAIVLVAVVSSFSVALACASPRRCTTKGLLECVDPFCKLHDVHCRLFNLGNLVLLRGLGRQEGVHKHCCLPNGKYSLGCGVSFQLVVLAVCRLLLHLRDGHSGLGDCGNLRRGRLIWVVLPLRVTVHLLLQHPAHHSLAADQEADTQTQECTTTNAGVSDDGAVRLLRRVGVKSLFCCRDELICVVGGVHVNYLTTEGRGAGSSQPSRVPTPINQPL